MSVVIDRTNDRLQIFIRLENENGTFVEKEVSEEQAREIIDSMESILKNNVEFVRIR